MWKVSPPKGNRSGYPTLTISAPTAAAAVVLYRQKLKLDPKGGVQFDVKPA
jgi:hypothetical protein